MREHAELWREAVEDLEAAARMLSAANDEATFTVRRAGRF
jgi:hypothetical protein